MYKTIRAWGRSL